MVDGGGYGGHCQGGCGVVMVAGGVEAGVMVAGGAVVMVAGGVVAAAGWSSYLHGKSV